MKEFITLMAFLTALVALSIDTMLPSLHTMSMDLHVAHPNDIQLVIGALFIGMTLGQVIYGPLADATGRKPALYLGMLLFVVGSAVSWVAGTLPMMLVGRFIQGLGVSGPRIVTLAIVRDKYHGREMAYVMSMVMGVFIMVPAVAPSIGILLIHLSGWRIIFLFYMLVTAIAFLWAHLRLEETLAREQRRAFDLKHICSGFKKIARTRVTVGYTLCSGIAFGALLGYLNSTQQIFQDLFHAGDRFALYFGLLALAIGSAFFSNSALVRRHGMRSITRYSLKALMFGSALFLPYAFFAHPNLVVFLMFAAFAFYCLGLTMGNMSAMALEPMGHMAGLASAFMGSVSTLISLLLGGLIGQCYDGTLVPLAVGFLVLSAAAYRVMQWTERTGQSVKVSQ